MQIPNWHNSIRSHWLCQLFWAVILAHTIHIFKYRYVFSSAIRWVIYSHVSTILWSWLKPIELNVKSWLSILLLFSSLVSIEIISVLSKDIFISKKSWSGNLNLFTINLGGNTCFFNTIFCTLNTDQLLVFPIFIENLVQRFEWIYSWIAKIFYMRMYINTQAISKGKKKKLYSE